MGCSPSLRVVISKLSALSLSFFWPSDFLPSKSSTRPLRRAASELTFAVNVMLAPKLDGFVDDSSKEPTRW